jgi:lysophospholipase L1-like esterase
MVNVFHRTRLTILLLAAAATCLAVARAGEKSNDGGDGGSPLPRVLLLGDSISIGYTPFVQQMLNGKAVVMRPMAANGQRAENCAGTTNGVRHVDRWLKIDGGRWDVIHFNFGLHDLKRVMPDSGKNSNDPTDPRQAEPDAYERQLREIAAKLKASGATLIFCTTTPVPEGGVTPHRDVEDSQRYNAIGRRIAAEFGAGINDLWAVAQPRLKEIQQPVNVHFTRDGSEFLARHVVKAIRRSLESETPGTSKQGSRIPASKQAGDAGLQADS